MLTDAMRMQARMYADGCYAYAVSLPKLLPAEGRLPERGFSKKIEAECERIRGLLLEQVAEFMPQGSPWENSMREPEGQCIRIAYVSIRQHTSAYVQHARTRRRVVALHL